MPIYATTTLRGGLHVLLGSPSQSGFAEAMHDYIITVDSFETLESGTAQSLLSQWQAQAGVSLGVLIATYLYHLPPGS